MTLATATLSPDQTQAILDARAEALARPIASAEPASKSTELAHFTLAGDRYAIESRWVHQIDRLQGFAPLSSTPGLLVGFAPSRGEILPIFDLRKLLGAAKPGLSDMTRVIVLGRDQPELGILADSAEDISRIHVDQILAPPEGRQDVRRANVRGVTSEGIVVIDGAALLDDPRLVIDED